MSIVLRYLAENQRWNVAGTIVYARERRLGEIIAASPRPRGPVTAFMTGARTLLIVQLLLDSRSASHYGIFSLCYKAKLYSKGK